MNIIEPPPAYMMDFPGPIFVHEYLASQVDGVCRSYGITAKGEIAACSKLLKGSEPWGCIVILPKYGVGGVGEATQDALRRHEIAHCSGWPADHPGGS